MGEKGLILANRFWDVYEKVVKTVQDCPNDRWANHCDGENESIGAVANHIAAGYRLELQLIIATLSGQPAPNIYVVEGELDRYHAEASRQFSHYNKADTLAHLQENAVVVQRYISEMSDADLAKPVQAAMFIKWFGRPITMKSVIELVIGHPEGHLRSILEIIARRPDHQENQDERI